MLGSCQRQRRYDGKKQFDQCAYTTGNRNVGSNARPLLYRDACDCAKEEEE